MKLAVDNSASDPTLSNLKVEIDKCNERIAELKGVLFCVEGDV